MKVQIDLTRNVPDFIFAEDGARMQDYRFVVTRKFCWFYVLYVRLIIKLYDQIKNNLRKIEQKEIGG